jgi:hypothetical protein
MSVPPFGARQRLAKHVLAETNTQATVEELLGTSFSMWSVSYQRKVGDWFFPELLALIWKQYFVFFLLDATLPLSLSLT